MWKDLMQSIKVIKAVIHRQKTATKPRYIDGFYRLSQRLHPSSQFLKIVKKVNLSHDVVLLRGVSTDEYKPLAPFRAGQYIAVKPIINGIKTCRAYSLVSSPNNLSYYEIAVKNVGKAGFVSQFLCDKLQVGEILEVSEPLGQFYHNSIFHGDHLVFIAGGCGVTPFISMIRDFYEHNSSLNVSLIYGCLTEKDILFKDELIKINKEMPNFQFQIVLSEPDVGWTGLIGFISKDIIRKVCPNLENDMFYIVGPEMMRDFVTKELGQLKVNPKRIIWEVSPPIANITKAPSWPQEISIEKTIKCTIRWFNGGIKTTQTFNAKCTTPLLNSIERENIPGLIQNSACRAGECGFCRSRLLGGKIFVPPNIHLREADSELGFIHPCVSYPLTDVEIELQTQNTTKRS